MSDEYVYFESEATKECYEHVNNDLTMSDESKQLMIKCLEYFLIHFYVIKKI